MGRGWVPPGSQVIGACPVVALQLRVGILISVLQCPWRAWRLATRDGAARSAFTRRAGRRGPLRHQLPRLFHHSPPYTELYAEAASLLTRLQQQGVPPALLLQCTAAADAAPGLAAAQAAAEAAGAPLLVTQPGQLPISLR